MNSAIFVQRARAELDKTQQEFADLLGVTRQTIIRYEQGDNLTVGMEMAICFLLWERNPENFHNVMARINDTKEKVLA